MNAPAISSSASPSISTYTSSSSRTPARPWHSPSPFPMPILIFKHPKLFLKTTLVVRFVEVGLRFCLDAGDSSMPRYYESEDGTRKISSGSSVPSTTTARRPLDSPPTVERKSSVVSISAEGMCSRFRWSIFLDFAFPVALVFYFRWSGRSVVMDHLVVPVPCFPLCLTLCMGYPLAPSGLL